MHFYDLKIVILNEVCSVQNAMAPQQKTQRLPKVAKFIRPESAQAVFRIEVKLSFNLLSPIQSSDFLHPHKPSTENILL